MKEQILKEVYISEDVDEANKDLKKELNKMVKKGFYVKQIQAIPNFIQRVFVLFEKSDSDD